MPESVALFHFLHVTVTDDTDLPREGKEAARKIETYGYSIPPMVSYHDLVTNEGLYFEGQSYGVKGTHTVNDRNVPGFPRDLNLYGYATALMQNIDDEVTDEQVEVVAMIFAARELEGWVRLGAPVYPHRMFSAKSCPGDRAVARINDIYWLKTEYVQNGLPTEEDNMRPEDFEKIRNIVREEIDAQFAEQITVKTASGTRLIAYTQLFRELWQKTNQHT